MHGTYSLASYPGSRYQKSWEMGNYCVISVQSWSHNVYLPSCFRSTIFIFSFPITLIDAPYYNSPRPNNHTGNWQTDTQCLILCLSSEILRPNIPYTKWRGLLNHLSSLVLWHSAASVRTRSKKKEPVYLVRLYEWIRVFRSWSESSHSCQTPRQCAATVALFQALYHA